MELHERLLNTEQPPEESKKHDDGWLTYIWLVSHKSALTCIIPPFLAAYHHMAWQLSFFFSPMTNESFTETLSSALNLTIFAFATRCKDG